MALTATVRGWETGDFAPAVAVVPATTLQPLRRCACDRGIRGPLQLGHWSAVACLLGPGRRLFSDRLTAA